MTIERKFNCMGFEKYTTLNLREVDMETSKEHMEFLMEQLSSYGKVRKLEVVRV